MKYGTALSGYGLKRVEEIESADIVVGIPCYNNERSIAHVIQMVSRGLFNHYKDMRSVIFVADGGSTDDTGRLPKNFSSSRGRKKWFPFIGEYRKKAQPFDPSFLRPHGC